ncbi:hypothetical protein KUV80_16845 [Fictibacillus nanhaiensis]|uniref:SRPBCC family protein n=1 Tax=Fictibacillus nanhaiensis TaxID=742169 RepID=UPI001C94DE33|nr:SRPBCC family protein [Fictibacillus nanhaiensis]MBY6038317.1 hypothetical protein [Fictibacillus nanhaiensis]
MNEIFSETVTIHGSVNDVWYYFIHLEENASKWMKGIPFIEKETKGDIKEGTKFVFQARGKEHSTILTEYEPMTKATLTSIQGNFQADYTYMFLQENDLTKITLVAKCDTKGFSKLLTPVIKWAIKKSDAGQLENLKQAFENR